MAIEILEGRKVIATRDTFDEAKAYVTEMGVAHMEDDADFTDCADAMLTDGRVIAIKPEGFKLNTAFRKGTGQ